MRFYKSVAAYTAVLVAAFLILFFPYLRDQGDNVSAAKSLGVLTYSSFAKRWGPGPELARRFEALHGIPIRWIQGGNAGLILERLRFKSQGDSADVVLGFDQFLLIEARKTTGWLDVSATYDKVGALALPQGAVFSDFLAFDWGPLTFVHRASIDPAPTHLRDLLSLPFKKNIILQDPRMSSPGLQFLFWILVSFGEDEGFRYLRDLKSSIQVMAPSWSTAYSLFQTKPQSLVFSYFTSPYYHEKEEGDRQFRAAVFSDPHPIQVEYAGIPTTCKNCKEAKLFLEFLVSAEAQKIIFEKNYMLPISQKALDATGFRLPENLKTFSPMESWSRIRDKKKWIEEWKKIFY